jgi:hypothetical protein
VGLFSTQLLSSSITTHLARNVFTPLKFTQAFEYAKQKPSLVRPDQRSRVEVLRVFYSGIPDPVDRLVFAFSLFDDQSNWERLTDLLGKSQLIDKGAAALEAATRVIKPKITAEMLMAELQTAKDVLFRDLSGEFKSQIQQIFEV